MVVKKLEEQIDNLMRHMDSLDKDSKAYAIAVANLCRMMKSYEELVSGDHARQVAEAKLFLEQEQQDAENDIKLAKLRNERAQLEDARLNAEIQRQYEETRDRLTLRDERMKFLGRLVFDGVTMAADRKWLSSEFEKSYFFEEHGYPSSVTTKDVRKQLPMLLKKR